MKVGNLAKLCTVGASLAMITAGFITAPAAMADPAGTPAVNAQTLAGYGSDTTQDVMNALAASVNTDHAADGAWVASYDALGDTTISNPKGATVGGTVPRANGSGDGLKLLQTATGFSGTQNIVSGTAKANVEATTAGTSALVNFSRSSSDRGNSTNATNGVFSYVPFAKDAVTAAVNPAATDPGMAALANHLTVGALGDTASTASIYSIYHCLAKYVYTNAGAYVGVGGTDTLPGGADLATPIKPLLPAYGSGTRKYFVTTVAGFASDSSTLTTTYSCLKDVVGGSPVNEHDGAPIATTGVGAIAPFSIPQWVAQSNSVTTGVTDRRNGAILLGLADVAPLDAGKTNAAFPIKRTVFNVLPYKKVRLNTTREYAVFNGASASSICSKGSVIESMGFIQLNVTSTPTSIADCGYIGNRFGAPTSASTTSTQVSTDYKQIASGDTVDVTVGASNPNGGTFAVYTDAAKVNFVGSGEIVAGDPNGTTTSSPISASAGSSVSFYGTFDPNDVLVQSSPVSTTPAVVKVVNPYTAKFGAVPGRVVTNTSTSIAVNIAPALTYPGAQVGGWATLSASKDGAAAVDVQTVYVVKRSGVANFSWKPTLAGEYDLSVEFAPEGSSPSLYGKDVIDVTVALNTTAIAVGTFAGWLSTSPNYVVSSGSERSLAPSFKVTMTKGGTPAAYPAGNIKVYLSTGKTGGTLLKDAVVLSTVTGQATITLPASDRWRVAGTADGVVRYLNVVFTSTDGKFYSTQTSIKVLIKNS